MFRPDAGVDTGPIVVQKGGVAIAPDDTAASLYFDKLYPLGVDAIAEAVADVAAGRAVYRRAGRGAGQPPGARRRRGGAPRLGEAGLRARPLDPRLRPAARRLGAARRRGGALLRRRARGRLAGVRGAGEVVRLADGAAWLAARGGLLRVGRVRVGEGPKQPAADALRAGERLR